MPLEAAILRGDSRANLQIFPDDRLVIGRKPNFPRPGVLDHAAVPHAPASNAESRRKAATRPSRANGETPARRRAALMIRVDSLQNVSPKGRGASIVEEASREAVRAQTSSLPPGE